MKSLIFLFVLVGVVGNSNVVDATWWVLRLGCVDDNPLYQSLAYHSDYYVSGPNDPHGGSFWRIAIWEPDLDNSCNWKLGYTVNTTGADVYDPGVSYSLGTDEWAGYLDPNRDLGVIFEKDYRGYMAYRQPSGMVHHIQVDLVDHANIPNNWYERKPNGDLVQVKFGETISSLYESPNGAEFRLCYAVCVVQSDTDRQYDPLYYEGTFRHTNVDVLRHELGHALLFGIENGLLSSGMYSDPPDRDRYLSLYEQEMIQCCYNVAHIEVCNDNVVAKASDFWVSDQLVATWDVLGEAVAGYYSVEELQGDEWVSVVDSLEVGLGSYSLSLGGSLSTKYRLIEHSGTRDEILAYASPGTRIQGAGGSSVNVDFFLDLAKTTYYSSNNAIEEVGLRNGESMVVIGPQVLLQEVATHCVPLWRDVWGCDVSFVYTDNLPGTGEVLLQGIKAVIDQKYGEGVRSVLLVGSANDYVKWQSDWWEDYWWEDIRQGYFSSGFPEGGNPSQDLVPTWYYRDSGQPDVCMSRGTTPYWYSDLGYSLVDSDEIPDLVVARWPVETVSDLKGVMAKMYSYSLGDIWNQGVPSRVSFFIGDLAYRTEIDDSVETRRIASDIKSILPTEVLNWTIQLSEIPDLSLRNHDFANSLNSVHPNLALVLSNGSNPFSIGGFIDFASWGMSFVDSGVSPVFLAASCMTADYARTTAGNIQVGTFGQFLFSPDRGASFWIGPSNPTWQVGNEVVLEALAGEFYSGSNEAMARKFYNIQASLLSDADLGVLEQRVVKSYGFFGDPLSPFRGGGYSPVPVPELFQSTPLQINTYPNPFNPRIKLSISLGTSGMLSVRVMDMRGRLVKTVFQGEKMKGNFLIEWDGTNSSGKSVASGQYLIEVVGPAERIFRKVTLVK